MANPNALIKLGEKALTKGSEKAIEKATTKAVTKATTEAVKDATTKAIVKSVANAGTKALAPKAGSALDGIIGRSSGITLPEPKITPKSLSDWSEGEYKDIVDVLKDDYTLKNIKNDKNLSKKNLDILKKAGEEGSYLNSLQYDQHELSNKSNLPKLNREQYYYDTLGDIKGKYVSAEDVPDYMQSHLSNDVDKRRGNDSILRDLFRDDEASLSELYDRYDELAQGANQNAVYTPENIELGLGLEDKKTRDALTQDFADRAYGGKRDIDVSKVSTGTKNVKISRPKAETGAMVPAQSEAVATSPELADDIASMKAKLGSTTGSSSGMGGNVGGGTATEMPGSDGFRVKLKDGRTTNIKVGPEAVGSSRQQRAFRKLDDMTAKGMNANAKQYRNVVGKSGSIDGHYKTIAERMRAEKIDQANVSQKAQAALSLREDIKQQGLQYAEANGVTLNLAGIDNTVGLSSAQKKKLSELGLGLDQMLGSSPEVTPTQAEEIYKILRDYAYKWSDSSDAITSVAGSACKKEADAVRDIIDNAMDNINVDYKTALLEEAAKNGEDPTYLRKLAGKKDFKFSDLRKDQSDWITINDLAGNKIKDEPTLNMFGVDTGMKNPFTAGAEKLKEKIYERQAYGGGAGGAGAGGGRFGGSGAENSINFEGAGGGTGTLGGLLGRAKNCGLVGAGVLGGLMLGGGSDGGSGGSNGFNVPSMEQNNDQPEIDPYTDLTIGGYNYEQLEAGYVAAMQAGDTDAAKMISNMMGMLDEKVKRYNDANEKSGGSGTASKQKAAMNVLSGLMQNYQAQGPIGGRATQLLNTLTGGSYNPAVSAYDSGSAGALGTIIKALGDTGALSEGDQKRALELLPRTTDSEAAAKAKYQQLMQILQGAGAQ
jgi:hypothetical protein